jgi:hypothetical protein
MTASPNPYDERIAFTTAREYYEGEEPDARPEGPRPAKGIVWYDQATPIFACLSCHDHVAPLRFSGTEFSVEDYDEVRAATYEYLFQQSPACDVCAGTLPEKVEI